MLKYFLENNLLSPKQSGFRPGSSCVDQLLSVTYYIFTSFDNGLPRSKRSISGHI